MNSKDLRLGLTFVLILLFQTCFSQSNFLPGYVIKTTGDTVHGFIDYRNWEKNPDKISFRIQIEDESVRYKPTNIVEFSVKDEVYVSGIVESLISPTEVNRLNEDPNPKIQVDTTFLQTLFEGSKSLYYYKNSDGVDNFYIKGNEGFELLVYKKYLIDQERGLVTSENRKFIGQLTFYLYDCPTIQSKLKGVSYNQKSLKKLFEYYYECTHAVMDFTKETEKTILDIGVVAGVSFTSVNFKGDSNFDYLVDANFDWSVNFTGGLTLEAIFPRNQRKWSINTELLYTSYSIKSVDKDSVHENKYSTTTMEIGFSYVNFNVLGRYQYPVGKLHVFLNGGISLGFGFGVTNSKIEEVKFWNTEKTVVGNALEDIRKFEVGYILGLGLKYSKFSFETRYELGNGFDVYTNLKSSTNNLFLLLGYRF